MPQDGLVEIRSEPENTERQDPAETEGILPMGKTNFCPSCHYLRVDIEFSTCPKCGIIIEKYHATKKRKEKPPEKPSSDENRGKPE